jgi:hypothetical protein
VWFVADEIQPGHAAAVALRSTAGPCRCAMRSCALAATTSSTRGSIPRT